jgi:hypothetical protein
VALLRWRLATNSGLGRIAGTGSRLCRGIEGHGSLRGSLIAHTAAIALHASAVRSNPAMIQSPCGRL